MKIYAYVNRYNSTFGTAYNPGSTLEVTGQRVHKCLALEPWAKGKKETLRIAADSTTTTYQNRIKARAVAKLKGWSL